MTTEISIVAGAVLFVLLLLAAYLNGHHNGRHSHQTPEAKEPPPKGNALDPAFILQSIEDGIIMVDAQGVIRLFNPAAERITGWPADEVVGLDFHSALNLIDERGQPYQSQERPFTKALTTAQVVHDTKASLVTKAGKRVPVSLIVSPIANPPGAIGVLRDITRERAEEEERTEFISTASHEMRTPIAAIEGYLSLVLNNKKVKLDDETRMYLEKAHSSTEHLGQLFQDLLTTTKAEDSRLQSKPEPVEIGSLISQIVEEARPAADKKNLSLHYLASGDGGGKVIKPLYYVEVDPERLKEVVRNLLDNAIKYTSAGNVTVRLTGDDSVVQFQVSDSGLGISPEDIPHLFQKFYRVDSAMTRGVGGTGLGLFICRKILDLYNGRIWVESRLGKGSTFFVNLPRLDSSKLGSGSQIKPVIQSPSDT